MLGISHKLGGCLTHSHTPFNHQRQHLVGGGNGTVGVALAGAKRFVSVDIATSFSWFPQWKGMENNQQ